MILTTHALIGAALGKYIANPLVLIPAAIAAHFAMDTFRHGEYAESFDKKTSFKNTWWKISADLIISGAIILSFMYFQDLNFATIKNMLLGSFFSMFPDLLTLLHWKFKFKILTPIYKFHLRVHAYPPLSKERKWTFKNAIDDIVFSLAAIIILFIK